MSKAVAAGGMPPSDASTRAKVTATGDNEMARRAWHLLSEVALTLRATWIDIAAEFDLTPAQALALRRLEPNTPLPMNTLAEAMICDASNVTGIVDKLEARGLIERRTIEHDRRVKMLVVTKRGEELRRRFLLRSSQPPPSIAALTTEDQRQLSDVLERLLAVRT